MKTICPNCKNALSCGCQKRVASDGKQVCSKCSAAYEQGLKNANGNSPSNVHVIYNRKPFS